MRFYGGLRQLARNPQGHSAAMSSRPSVPVTRSPLLRATVTPLRSSMSTRSAGMEAAREITAVSPLSNQIKLVCFGDLDPWWRADDPAPHLRGGDGGGEFRLSSRWKNHAFKQAWKELDVADRNEVVDRACIRNGKLHRPGRRAAFRSATSCSMSASVTFS